MVQRWAVVLAALMIASAACCAQVDEAAPADEIVTVPLTDLPELLSARPQFARLLATPAYRTALWLILDESRGTGTGYDLVYADFDYDGAISEDEIARGQAGGSGDMVFGRFPSFGVPEPGNPNQPAGEKPRVMLGYQAYSGKSFFTVSAMIRMQGESGRPDDSWQYQISAQLRTGTSPENAPLTRLGGEPAVKIDARPDGTQRHTVGIGLTVTFGGSFCDPRTAAGSPDAVVVIRNAAGEIVHRAVQRLDRFCFG